MAGPVFDPEVYGEPVYSDVLWDTDVYGEWTAEEGTNATAGVAAGTGAASGAAAPSVAPGVEIASGVGESFQATVSTGNDVNVDAEVASGTGAASGLSSAVAPGSGVGAGTGAASNLSSAASTNVETATGTVAAGGAAPSVKPASGVAAGTGAAYGETAVSTTTAGAGAGTGTSPTAHANVAPRAEAASAAGAAFAVIPTVAPGSAQAQGVGKARSNQARATYPISSWVPSRTPRVILDGLGDITDLVVFEQTELSIAAQGESSMSTMVILDNGVTPLPMLTGRRMTVDLPGPPQVGTEETQEGFGTDGTNGWPGWTLDYGTASYASVASGIASAVIPYPTGAIGQFKDILSIEGATEWSLLMRFRIDPATHLDPSIYLYLSGFEVDIDVYPFPVPDMYASYSLLSFDDSASFPTDDPWDSDWRFAEVTVASSVAEFRIWKDGDARPASPTLTCAATTPAAPVYAFGNDLYVDINMGSESGAAEDATYEIDYITISKGADIPTGDVIWAGYLMQASRQFWFDVDTETTANRRWTLQLADINLLFNKRVTFKKADPDTVEGPLYRNPTYDDDIITDLLDDWLDLSTDDLDLQTLVNRVAIVNPSSVGCHPPDQSFYPFNASETWGQAMTTIAQVPAAIWGLVPGEPIGSTPFGRLFYADVDDEDAPFALTDNPTASGVGYHEFTILEDGSELVNEAFSWGAGKGVNHMVFNHETASSSITEHGLWQQGDLIFDVWCDDTISKIGDSIVNGSPGSRRGHKDPISSVELTVDHDGLKVGQRVHVINEEFAFDEILPIRRMQMTFPTPENVRYQLTLSDALDRWGYRDPRRVPVTDGPPITENPTPLTCWIDTFNDRDVNPGWGTVSPLGQFAWDPPVYDEALGGVVLAHVTGDVGRMDFTLTGVHLGVPYGDAQMRLEGGIQDVKEFVIQGHVTMAQNFVNLHATEAGVLQLAWVVQISDDFDVGMYYTAMYVYIIKQRATTSGPITFYVVMDITDDGGGHIVLEQELATALIFDWRIDRSVTRGTTKFSNSHFNNGVAYEIGITDHGDAVGSTDLIIEGAAVAQNSEAGTDWISTITNDYVQVCELDPVYGTCWYNPPGLFDDFNRTLITPVDIESPVGCSSAQGYVWIEPESANDLYTTLVLDGGWHVGKTYANGFNFAAGRVDRIYIPIDAQSLKIEFDLEMAVPTWSELHNKSAQNKSGFYMTVRRRTGPDFDPTSASNLQEYFWQLEAFSGTGSFPSTHTWGIERTLMGNASEKISEAQNDFSAGVHVIFEVEDGVARLTVGADVDTFTIAPEDAGGVPVFGDIEISAELINNAIESWGANQTTSPDSAFKSRVSNLTVWSGKGSCVLVPPRAVSPWTNYNGQC